MELIEFILLIIVILYIVRMIVRIVVPMLFQRLVNKAQQHQQNYQQNYTQTNHTKTGKIRIDHIPQQPKGKIPDSEGDFIDYEEIK
jgi:hypothetical protein